MTIKDLLNLDEATRGNFISQEIKEVFPTLSVPWYVGRAITVMLSDNASTAYYSPTEEKIVVATQLVTEACNKILARLASNPKLATKYVGVTVERLVRTVLFHEASHAMLTPAQALKYTMYGEMVGVINILEDQRIELINSKFFLDCDFEVLRELLIEDTPILDDKFTPIDAFLSFVRRGDMTWASLHPTKDLRQMLVKWLKNYRNITRATEEGDVWNYYQDARRLWEEFKSLFTQQNQQQQQSQQQQQNQPQGQEQPQTQGQGQSQEPPEDEDPPQSQSQQQGGGQNNDKGQKDNQSSKSKESEGQQKEDTPSNLKPIDESDLGSDFSLNRENGSFADQMGWEEPPVDPSIEREFMRIFGANEKRKRSTASMHAGFSGQRVDIHLVARENENGGKIFVRSGEGSMKGAARYHLNLFLDESGSMKHNENEVNRLLTALFRVEKRIPSFSWTWIGCADGQRIYPKNECPAKYVATGNTYLSSEIHRQIKEVQARDALNLNLVLYDGGAGRGANWGAFNRPDTVVITDRSNEQQIDCCWGKTRKGKCIVIRGDYAKVLIETLIKELELLTNKL